MTEEDVLNALSLLIEGNTLKTRVGRYTSVDWFLKTYEDYELTYDSLVSYPNVVDNGWKSIFDEWKQKGILN